MILGDNGDYTENTIISSGSVKDPSTYTITKLTANEIDATATNTKGTVEAKVFGTFDLSSLSSTPTTVADLMNDASLGTVSSAQGFLTASGVTSQTQSQSFSTPISFTDFVDLHGFAGVTAMTAAFATLLSGNDTYNTSSADTLNAAQVDLYGGNNTFYENHPLLQNPDLFYGGSSTGINTAVLPGPSSNYVITSGNVWDVATQANDLNGYTITDNTKAINTLQTYQVERLQFSDTKIALDVGNGGHAGETAEILGAVFGASSIAAHPNYVGIGLIELDSGMSVSQLSTLALQAAGATNNAAIVNLLYTNIIGVAPTAAQAAPFLNALNNGMTVGTLAVLAEGSSLNDAHINLVGLQQTGIHYV